MFGRIEDLIFVEFLFLVLFFSFYIKLQEEIDELKKGNQSASPSKAVLGECCLISVVDVSAVARMIFVCDECIKLFGDIDVAFMYVSLCVWVVYACIHVCMFGMDVVSVCESETIVTYLFDIATKDSSEKDKKEIQSLKNAVTIMIMMVTN